jgi:thiamine-monophosphate kinase
MNNNSHSKIQELGEFGLIDHLVEKITTRKGTILGIGDDCALLESLQAPVVTVDTLIEGVHFRRDWIENFSSPRALGWKSLAVSVSDLAAMGATPVAAFISLAVPKNEDLAFVDALYEGFEQCAETYGFTIAGGDTVASPVLNISATLIGNAFSVPVRRSGAQVGDIISVSGNLGDSAAGLYMLQNEIAPKSSHEEFLLQRHFEPIPRLDEMQRLLSENSGKIHASLDLSDGISSDAKHIARRSNVSLQIDLDSIPMSVPALELAQRCEVSPFGWAIAGGEDYEILICSSEEIEDWIPIGRVIERDKTAPKEVIFFRDNQEIETSIGWRHF